MLLFKENQENSENRSDLCHLNGFSSHASDDHDSEDVQDESEAAAADDNFEKFNEEDEADAVEEEEMFENQSNFDNMDGEFSKSIDEGEEEEEVEFSSLKGTDLSEKIKSNPTAADLTAYMRHLSSLLPTIGAQASSNVMLEPIEATKAAVAQFAENNPDQEKDVGKLHAALFNLQQQQLMQLQLIHQLQQQLVSGNSPNSQLTSAFLNGQLGANIPGLSLNLPGMPGSLGGNQKSSKSSSRNESPSPKPESPAHGEKGKTLSRSSSPSRSEATSPVTSGSSSQGLGDIQESPVSLLMNAANKAGSHSTPSSSSPSGLLNFSRSSTKGKILSLL